MSERPTPNGPRIGTALALAAALALGGCRTGPSFVPPAPPAAPGYADSVARWGGPTVALGRRVPLRWWEAFCSPALDSVVAQAVAQNQTLAAAQASLAQAREVLAEARGGRWPGVDASVSAERQETGAGGRGAATADGAPGRTASLFSLGSAISVPLDLFGGVRRLVEQQGALANAADHQLSAAYLTVTGTAVTQVISIAGLGEQSQALDEIVAYDQRNLELVEAKQAAGKAALVDVLSARAQLESDSALAPPLRQQLAVARHALSVLVGRLPSEWTPPTFALGQLALPGELPVSVSSELVRQRPDILVAEAQMHAASAAIGVAVAQRYPSMTISGSLARQGVSPNALLGGQGTAWDLLDGITAPLFHGGRLRAQERAAVDVYRSASAEYRTTVLSAFQQVADVLYAIGTDRAVASAQARALETSASLLELQRLSYEVGKSNLLQLLDAQRSYQQARLADARARAAVYQDAATLVVAMGGGWWQATGDERRGWGRATRTTTRSPSR